MTSTRLRYLGFWSLAVFGFWACTPDLDALVAGNSAGSAGSTSGSNSGGNGGTVEPSGGTTGDPGGEGGTTSAGKGGSSTAGSSSSGSSGEGGAPPEPAACDNQDRDSNESDVDCGGTSDCDRCENNLRCSRDEDCASSFCKGTRCAEPTCGDGYKNQDETARDCGGSCAPELACDDGQACLVHEDCSSEFCKDEVCTDHCTSGRVEADETDEDCGGADCGPCGDNKDCSIAADCISKVCFNNECQPPTCDDNVLNQDESDRDCGGVCAAESPCEIDEICNTGADCESWVCTAGRCAPDIEVLDEDVIDSLEDGNFVIEAIGGRGGNWYPYGDGTGAASIDVSLIPGGRGESALGMHTAGSGFMTWGSGIGLDLNNMGGGQGDKVPYDATAYTGVTFWARAAADITLTVVMPDKDTDAAGGICNQPEGVCDHHYLKAVQVDTEWRRYTVLFTELTLESGGAPIPTAFAPDGIVSVQFRFNTGMVYDLWVDDVAFVR
jgi:hypothetical protein